MLTNKGYYIPKYLYRRKIEHIRQKIIKRKYGYMFYRKTFSEILPSQARRHYEVRLISRCFNRWVLYWYKEVIEWKLMLRAEIHYKLSLQHHFLKRWKYLCIQRKASRIKQKIAVTYNRKNYIRQLKLFCIVKWKIYIKYRQEKKQKIRIAWNLFKSKYKPEHLLPFLKRWEIFTKASKKNKMKEVKAEKFFEKKLTVQTLAVLLRYAKEKKLEKETMADARNLYENKLLRRTIKIWLLHIAQKQQEEQNITLANIHYCCKLKSNYFKRFLKNKSRNQFIRSSLTAIKERQNKRIILSCFVKLKDYIGYRLLKKKEQCKAIEHYKTNLKKKSFASWEKYLRYRIEKLKLEEDLLEQVTDKLNIYLLKKCIRKWRKFNTYKKGKKRKLTDTICFYKMSLQRTIFKSWIYFVSYKKFRKEQIIDAINFHKNRMKNLIITAWKTYVKGENEYRQKLRESKLYYERNVINEALLIIMKAGLNKKEEKLRKSRDEIHHQLFLSQKYISIWKQNVFYKNVGNEVDKNKSIEEEDKENIPQTSNFDWYQICFLTPRLPKNYIDHLSNSSS